MDFTEKAWRVVALLALLILALSMEPASHPVQNIRDDALPPHARDFSRSKAVLYFILLLVIFLLLLRYV